MLRVGRGRIRLLKGAPRNTPGTVAQPDQAWLDVPYSQKDAWPGPPAHAGTWTRSAGTTRPADPCTGALDAVAGFRDLLPEGTARSGCGLFVNMVPRTLLVLASRTCVSERLGRLRPDAPAPHRSPLRNMQRRRRPATGRRWLNPLNDGLRRPGTQTLRRLISCAHNTWQPTSATRTSPGRARPGSRTCDRSQA
ncbi:hypothetical protein HBB16_00050 [Pseudonocardia sp. MCCB 268]|nr:hypothetical protein [Pseudonocardia cytotoxica]